MAKFLCAHTVPPNAVTIDQVKQISRAAQSDKVVRGVQSFGNLAEGKISCIFEGPNREAVANFFKANRMPVDSIVQMDFEGEAGSVAAL